MRRGSSLPEVFFIITHERAHAKAASGSGCSIDQEALANDVGAFLEGVDERQQASLMEKIHAAFEGKAAAPQRIRQICSDERLDAAIPTWSPEIQALLERYSSERMDYERERSPHLPKRQYYEVTNLADVERLAELPCFELWGNGRGAVWVDVLRFPRHAALEALKEHIDRILTDGDFARTKRASEYPMRPFDIIEHDWAIDDDGNAVLVVIGMPVEAYRSCEQEWFDRDWVDGFRSTWPVPCFNGPGPVAFTRWQFAVLTTIARHAPNRIKKCAPEWERGLWMIENEAREEERAGFRLSEKIWSDRIFASREPGGLGTKDPTTEADAAAILGYIDRHCIDRDKPKARILLESFRGLRPFEIPRRHRIKPTKLDLLMGKVVERMIERDQSLAR